MYNIHVPCTIHMQYTMHCTVHVQYNLTSYHKSVIWNSLILTFVTDEIILLPGCSPLVSTTSKLSPKSQKICLKYNNIVKVFIKGHVLGFLYNTDQIMFSSMARYTCTLYVHCRYAWTHLELLPPPTIILKMKSMKHNQTTARTASLHYTSKDSNNCRQNMLVNLFFLLNASILVLLLASQNISFYGE